MSDVEFVPLPSGGRRFSSRRLIRLGDAGADGLLRLDGVARFLQDVATDDWSDTGVDPESTWLVRRTAVRLADGGRWPRIGEAVDVTTWCGGWGAAWAERRTDISLGGQTLLECVALWVPVDRSGRPQRIRQSFLDVYQEAAGGRKVSGRITASEPPLGSRVEPWTIRRSDLDVVGHANNAALWCSLVEVLDGPVSAVVLTHHGPIEWGDRVDMTSSGDGFWLIVDGDVRVSAQFKPS
jgi:acyl-ACP thioesterase